MSIYVKDTERGVKVLASSTFFKPFCEGWLDNMASYAKSVPGDWPFWYGERPLVGFFAAGIWGSGSVCMEEYAADKKPGVKERRNETYLGRCDLYFSTGRREGEIEFKMRNIGISRAQRFAGSLRAAWRKGKDEPKTGNKIQRFAGIFLRPYIGIEGDPSHYEANLKHLLRLAWDVVKPDALAWWCPTKNVLKTSKDTNDWVIGAILLIKQVN